MRLLFLLIQFFLNDSSTNQLHENNNNDFGILVLKIQELLKKNWWLYS